jgi:hypothetical protein
VEHVFIVGVGGAVPHYTDFDQHVRLGDVVLSSPPKQGQRFVQEKVFLLQSSILFVLL